jgi:hypothetical protein
MNTKTDSQPSDSTEANKADGGDCVSRLVVPLRDCVEVLPPLDTMACERCATTHPEPALYLCDNCGERVCRSCYNERIYECKNCAPGTPFR